MKWNEASEGLAAIERTNTTIDVNDIHYDSRHVGPGDIFVAMRGGANDGNRYVDSVLAQGASAIVTDSTEVFSRLSRTHPNAALALVEHGRRALAELSAAILRHPEQKLALSAVTGTNGKTTTTLLLEQMLQSAHRTCVLIGTIETHVADQVRVSAHTTPEASDTLRIFADGVQAGATEAIMEMSSHALEQERVWAIPVDVAIFTNLTQDHLDFHGTMERYFAAKAKLFEGIGAPPPRVAVVNADDSWAARGLGSAQAERMRYGVEDTTADYRAENIELRAGDTRFLWKTPHGDLPIQSPLTGKVNVYNLLAASCAALARGLTLEQVAHATKHLRQVPGRFEVVPSTNGVTVVIDYAHTDDALRNLISLARALVKGRGGRVITLFGCGGDRDRAKRPKMGRAAGEGSDLVILTSDNPRTEDPMTIIEEALAGVRETGTTCIVEEDRAGAIDIAIRSAQPGDIVLIAGKGHEKVQILQDGTVPFDDVAVAADVLKEIA